MGYGMQGQVGQRGWSCKMASPSFKIRTRPGLEVIVTRGRPATSHIVVGVWHRRAGLATFFLTMLFL